MSVTDWLFGVIVVSFVAVLCLGARAGGLDLSTRTSRTYALFWSLLLGVGFFSLADAWIGLCIPAAVLVLMFSGLSGQGTVRSLVPPRPVKLVASRSQATLGHEKKGQPLHEAHPRCLGHGDRRIRVCTRFLR